MKSRAGIFRACEPYLYLLPTMIGLVLFSAGAVAASFLLSFTQWDIISPPQWTWFGNYADLWGSDFFWEVLRNTFLFVALAVPLSVGAALGLALLVNTGLRGITVFRTAYFLPVVSSMIAVALVWSWILNPQYGLLNYMLRTVFGVQGPASMVIFLAGLQNIPPDLYHAATIDGAGAWSRFRHVTLPLLSPTTFFVLVITLINAFQVFEQTYVMTKGGPANSTVTLSYYVYQNAFQFFQMGKAAAVAYVLFAFLFVLTLVQFRAQKRWVFYG